MLQISLNELLSSFFIIGTIGVIVGYWYLSVSAKRWVEKNLGAYLGHLSYCLESDKMDFTSTTKVFTGNCAIELSYTHNEKQFHQIAYLLRQELPTSTLLQSFIAETIITKHLGKKRSMLPKAILFDVQHPFTNSATLTWDDVLNSNYFKNRVGVVYDY